MTMQEPYDTGAEQAARRTAAAAVLADYQRAAETEDVASRAMWAARLADMLGYVLAPAAASPRVTAAAPALETEQQARELPAVRAVWAAFDADPGPGKLYPHNEAMLLQACAAAGVTLGAFDRRILGWLAGWEPTTCAVIAGLITRAAAAGQKMLPPGYESVLGQAVRDAVRYCELTGGKRLIEQANFYRSVAPALGIAVDPR
jgi:hypothetical protein